MRTKTGGRAAGTPNRRTIEVAEKLANLGCDPIAGMAQIAMNTSNPVELRGRMYAELAHYVSPKRKALALEVGSEKVVRFNFGVPLRQISKVEQN